MHLFDFISGLFGNSIADLQFPNLYDAITFLLSILHKVAGKCKSVKKEYLGKQYFFFSINQTTFHTWSLILMDYLYFYVNLYNVTCCISRLWNGNPLPLNSRWTVCRGRAYSSVCMFEEKGEKVFSCSRLMPSSGLTHSGNYIRPPSAPNSSTDHRTNSSQPTQKAWLH